MKKKKEPSFALCLYQKGMWYEGTISLDVLPTTPLLPSIGQNKVVVYAWGCGACGGTGVMPCTAHDGADCHRCDGEGYLVCSECNGYGVRVHVDYQTVGEG